jgi:uncharacterized protein
MSPRTALIVMAKAPVAGLAKTRLIPALGEAGAAALAQRLLTHAAQQAALAGFDALEICTTPDATHPAFVRLQTAHGLALTPQGPGDLGARMHRAFTRVLAQQPQALLMGTDAPGLTAARLQEAAAVLAKPAVDAVFIPALDGGYALVGLKAPQTALFDGMTWSTPQVMQHTRERAAAAGLAWRELTSLADVDEPADLTHLPAFFLETTT